MYKSDEGENIADKDLVTGSTTTLKKINRGKCRLIIIQISKKMEVSESTHSMSKVT